MRIATLVAIIGISVSFVCHIFDLACFLAIQPVGLNWQSLLSISSMFLLYGSLLLFLCVFYFKETAQHRSHEGLTEDLT